MVNFSNKTAFVSDEFQKDTWSLSAQLTAASASEQSSLIAEYTSSFVASSATDQGDIFQDIGEGGGAEDMAIDDGDGHLHEATTSDLHMAGIDPDHSSPDNSSDSSSGDSLDGSSDDDSVSTSSSSDDSSSDSDSESPSSSSNSDDSSSGGLPEGDFPSGAAPDDNQSSGTLSPDDHSFDNPHQGNLPAGGGPVDNLSPSNSSSGSSSNAIPDLASAAAFLNIDWNTGRISPDSTLRLRRYQIIHTAEIVQRAEGPVGGAIIAQPSGSGKTIETLAAIYFLSLRRTHDHKAIVVLCPPALIRQWMRQIDNFFKDLITLRVFYHLPHDPRAFRPLDVARLGFFLGSLDPQNPLTSRTIILSTPNVLGRHAISKETVDVVDLMEIIAPGSRRRVRQEPRYRLNLDASMIGTVIVDEADCIKDSRGKSNHLVRFLNARVNLLVTATPAKNRISDIRGFLYILHKGWCLNWPRHDVWNRRLALWRSEPLYFAEAYEAGFNPFKAVLTGRAPKNLMPRNASQEYQDAVKNGIHLWRLDPEAYRNLGQKFNWDSRAGTKILKPILDLCLMRRFPGGTIRLPDDTYESVGDPIPPSTIDLVPMKFADEAKAEYRLLYAWYRKLLFTGLVDIAGPQGSHVADMNELPHKPLNTRAYWRLCAFSRDPALYAFILPPAQYYVDLTRPVAPGGVIDCEYFRQMDHHLGMIWRYYMTCADINAPPPQTRIDLVRFLCRKSPAIQWLLVKLWGYKQQGHKVLVYVVRPLVQWEIEGICALFGFNFLSLRCTHPAVTRSKVLEAFSAANSPYDFVIATARTTGSGLDLHYNCSKTIIFELPPNVATVLQCAGRTHRLGQTQDQEVLIPWVVGSFDNWNINNMSNKYRPLLASGYFTERGAGGSWDTIMREGRAAWPHFLNSHRITGGCRMND
ncbi:hypothetical protein GQ53DRAFT_875646 [Thozetella sp. PMI_491]|nr:hypothetical protein GQ53DRAFT_875646 [Thozetella sp. PMI_491]